MSTTLTQCTISGGLLAALQGSAIGTLITPAQQIQLSTLLNLAFANGAGASMQANQFYMVSGTIASSGHTDIDLYAFGGANDLMGNALTMAVCKALFIQNQGISTGVSANFLEADTLIVGNEGTTAAWAGGSPGFFGANTHTITLPSPPANGAVAQGGQIIAVAPGATGWPVGSSTTNHKLRLTSGASSNTIRYNLIAIGATS